MEGLYRAGATNVDLTFENNQPLGCEVLPPSDVDARRKLIALIKGLRQSYDDDYDEELESTTWTEEKALDLSDRNPWTVFY